ncbi:MAG: redoxin domain-containing protein [Methyloligellaceae bacterium]
MAVRVGDPAPDIGVDVWVREAHEPQQMSLADYRGRWVVLFFYPRDFTFVCPTEIAAFASMQDAFKRLGAVVIGASTDSFFSHNAWIQQDERLRDVAFPIIADTTHKLAKAFNILLDDGAALRGTFIIDPEGIVRHMTVNEVDVARNMDETMRVLQALQSRGLCPVGWRPGQRTLSDYNEWLAKVFPRVTTVALSDATDRLEAVAYQPGDIIIRQDDEADRFYIVVEGEVAVIRVAEMGEEVELATLGPGEIFGEIGILMETRRTADVRANTYVKLLTLDWDDFESLVKTSDPTTNDFMRIVEQRRAQLPH